MGLRDRLAKALNLPPGTVVQTQQQIESQTPQSGMLAEALERNPLYGTVPFAPGRPLVPALINPPREDGRTAPRRYEFPVAWNLQITEQRVVPFRLLRDVADMSDLSRKCIEVVKAAISGMEWDIVLSDEATERIIGEAGEINHVAAAREARLTLMPEITRCRDFWLMPDRINGLSFPEWIAMAIEEMLVIDALSIYPNKTLDEENLHSLEILDGATIKPLLDDRGSRPIPPHPAYQQILWGFPRGEFTASADADGEFTADDLVYAPRTRRPFTPYGYSAVERALPMIDLYMKRLQWLRTEYTDGAVPETFMQTDASFGQNPELLAAYERIMNDDLAGKMEQRRRIRMLAEGMNPVFPPSADSRYSSEIDEYIVKQVCSHFGVLPTQIGFAPKGGLGGGGIQEGEAATSEIIGLKPVVMWLQDLMNQLSYRFLNMPKDLTFTFRTDSTESDNSEAVRREMELRSGQMTLNEARAETGRPLFTFPEADMPLINRALAPAAMAEELATAPAPDSQPEVEGDSGADNLTEGVEAPTDPARVGTEGAVLTAELEAFRKWTKGARQRPFRFEHVDPDDGDALNALAQNDVEAARQLALILKKEAEKDSFKPPKGVQAAAQRALDWLKEGHAGSGFTDVGRKRASDLARGANVSRETIGRMANYFARHAPDRKATGFNSGEEGFPTPGRVAWDAWGGDAGRTWAQGIVDRDKEKAAKAGDARGRDSASGLARGESGQTTDQHLQEPLVRFAWSRE